MLVPGIHCNAIEFGANRSCRPRLGDCKWIDSGRISHLSNGRIGSVVRLCNGSCVRIADAYSFRPCIQFNSIFPLIVVHTAIKYVTVLCDSELSSLAFSSSLLVRTFAFWFRNGQEFFIEMSLFPIFKFVSVKVRHC